MSQIGKQKPILNVCIVGYGLAGIITAIGLSKQGHKVTIYERDCY